MPIKIIKMDTLGSQYEPRYVVTDAETGKVLDDAQGYGYRSFEKARAAYYYKNNPPKEDTVRRRRAAAKWLKQHEDFANHMEANAFYAIKCGDSFTAKDIREMFDIEDVHPTDFEAKDLFHVWKNGGKV